MFRVRFGAISKDLYVRLWPLQGRIFQISIGRAAPSNTENIGVAAPKYRKSWKDKHRVQATKIYSA